MCLFIHGSIRLRFELSEFSYCHSNKRRSLMSYVLKLQRLTVRTVYDECSFTLVTRRLEF